MRHSLPIPLSQSVARFSQLAVADHFVALLGWSGRFPLACIADILTKAPARVVFIDLLRLIDAYAQDGIACPA